MPTLIFKVAFALVWLGCVVEARRAKLRNEPSHSNLFASARTSYLPLGKHVVASRPSPKKALETLLFATSPGLRFSPTNPTGTRKRSLTTGNRHALPRLLMSSRDEISAECIWLGVCASAVAGNGYGEAVDRNTEALRFIAEDISDMHAFVLQAVKQNGYTLKYASDDLKNDPEIVRAAVSQNVRALMFAGEAARRDREIILAAVQQKGSALKFASEDLQNDHEFVLAAVQESGLALQYAGEDQRKDLEVVLAAVQQNGAALKYASEILRDDRTVALRAVKQNRIALDFVGEGLKNDPELNSIAKEQSKKVAEMRKRLEEMYKK